MRLQIIAIGQKMPAWVADAYADYAGRMPPELRMELRELPPGDRGRGGNPTRARDIEGQRIIKALPAGARTVALDLGGRQETTERLAQRLSDWMLDGREIALVIGGPDGLAPEVLAAAEHRWCVSRLTLPHMLVRVVLAEQLYRAWSILANHPYHR
ncbi:23S rRNA (pseudouridine1915-N3)-methyltransferase [Natronocella acetinitrilica]|uniref:Ribosomal RNA large subunit methyltransferase H n=1 Tax=Natronocella acetinitrilica TaxID=414046 RepID=A0AAE3G1G5_9GAMM|nr:23S rRNA (pseudouridine(1915)-N(3))-methyltransferase RlmH [Natronocella acetinitrilica]MCP1673906.1 23S rRNA (pseudouridine1915-N3)-methyltransferase [Natronocella acetinitrilica]